MKIFKTEIIPVKVWYFNRRTNVLLSESYDYSDETLDLESIAFFAATGFFFYDSTYYKDIKVIPPASTVSVGENNQIISISNYWEWYYNPIIRDVEEATELFKMGFERNLFNAIKDNKVILPLSGGIDSRTIAAAIPAGKEDLQSYSYEYEGGVEEVKYGKAIADIKNFPFRNFKIPKGYLWDKIDELSRILNHEAEYTHSRQISILDELESLGDIFVLGHGGEIFKAPTVKKDLSFEGLADHLYNLFVTEAGLELGEKLWKEWGLKGNLKNYIKDIFAESLNKIKIKEVNPKLRAFIYKYVAHRKNQINVNIFARKNQIYLPFLHQDVLNGICNVHEDILIDRKVQINYIKQKSPAIAAVPWQDYSPLNLYNYQKYFKKSYLPVRAINFAIRIVNEKITGKKLIIRNWENQLLGKENDKQLQKHFFKLNSENNLIPQNIIKDFYNKFNQKDCKAYITPISTLLSISNFQNQLKNKKRENENMQLVST